MIAWMAWIWLLPACVGTTEGFQAVVLSGTVRWTLDFDAAAEAAGFWDCGYGRAYAGTQYLDAPWLCPDCEVIAGGTARLLEGVDCYSQISDTSGTRFESWGIGSEGGFFRASTPQFPLSELDSIPPVTFGEVTALTWSSEGEVDGGSLMLEAEGRLTAHTEPEVLLADPLAPRDGAYACGWPQAEPEGLESDYRLETGGIFPNGAFVDACGEDVRIWDLAGRYLVIESANPDCGPCQDMAAAETANLEALAAEGFDVMMVTLMGAGLAEPWASPEVSLVTAWAEEFELEDPVLVDRGLGYALFSLYLEDVGFGWPAWVVVAPDLRVLGGGVGSGGWDVIADLIRDDAR